MARVGDPAGSGLSWGRWHDHGSLHTRQPHTRCAGDGAEPDSALAATRCSRPAPPHKVPDLVGPLDVLPITGSGQAYQGTRDR